MAHLTKLKQHVWRIVMLVLTCVCALPAKAQNINYTPPDGEKQSFVILNSNNFWPTIQDLSLDEYESQQEAAGTKWKLSGFKYLYNANGITAGHKDVGYVAKLWNIAPIKEKISTIATYIKVDIGDCTKSVKQLYLEISESPDFTNSTIVSVNSPLFDGQDEYLYKIVEFKIPAPAENMYYRINYDLDKGTKAVGYNTWFRVDFVIGCESAIEVPVLTANAEKTEYSVVSTTGELHLLLAKYNSEGQLIEEIEAADQSTEAQAKVPAADDTSWKHKVGDVNENYTFTAPGENEYLALRAKTVAGTAQSAEIANFIRKDGIITGASQIVMAEESDNIRWFNMQGNEVTAPSKGIYIRVKSGKAEKIVF